MENTKNTMNSFVLNLMKQNWLINMVLHFDHYLMKWQLKLQLILELNWLNCSETLLGTIDVADLYTMILQIEDILPLRKMFDHLRTTV